MEALDLMIQLLLAQVHQHLLGKKGKSLTGADLDTMIRIGSNSPLIAINFNVCGGRVLQ